MSSSSKKHRRALVWFRRDLRVADQRAFHTACETAEEVIPFYIISPWKKQHRWTGPNRQAFLCESLSSLEKNITSLGGQLIYRRGEAVEEIGKLLTDTGADALHFSFDPDPFGKAAEDKVRLLCSKRGIVCRGHLDGAIHGPEDALTGSGTPYRVFTPFSKTWLALDKPEIVPKPSQISTPDDIDSLPAPTLATWDLPGAADGVLRGGERAARERLAGFIENRIVDYKANRDLPAGGATSRLSQDLRFGTISARQAFYSCQKAAASSGRDHGASEAIRSFITEIAWREFYFSVLHHFPEVLDHEFNPDYRGLTWGKDEDLFTAWKNGETGFPIVDAGMRQLAATGFMHNRVRMIVSMFLTKDLHLDWRLGEQHFMQHLVDGEIASNNGGWQWSAGTGADAAPYFRIQNPWSQTKRHDPKGEYIKNWIPELANTDPKKFTAPPEDGQPLTKGYPHPIVDHAEERKRTLEMFKAYRAA